MLLRCRYVLNCVFTQLYSTVLYGFHLAVVTWYPCKLVVYFASRRTCWSLEIVAFQNCHILTQTYTRQPYSVDILAEIAANEQVTMDLFFFGAPLSYKTVSVYVLRWHGSSPTNHAFARDTRSPFFAICQGSFVDVSKVAFNLHGQMFEIYSAWIPTEQRRHQISIEKPSEMSVVDYSLDVLNAGVFFVRNVFGCASWCKRVCAIVFVCPSVRNCHIRNRPMCQTSGIY